LQVDIEREPHPSAHAIDDELSHGVLAGFLSSFRTIPRIVVAHCCKRSQDLEFLYGQWASMQYTTQQPSESCDCNASVQEFSQLTHGVRVVLCELRPGRKRRESSGRA
jgi:hypothetical protein